MKITFISMYYPPDISGGAWYTYKLKNALINLGIEIEVITSTIGTSSKNNKSRNDHFKFSLNAASKIGNVDLVHSFNHGSVFVLNKPVIEHIHHYDYALKKDKTLRHQLGEFAEKFCYKKARVVTTLSKFAAMDLEKIYGKKEIFVIPCGVDEVYAPEVGNSLKILCTSGQPFSLRKDTEILITAFLKVKKQFPKTELHITGKWIDGQYEQKGREFLSTIKNLEGIKFTGVLNTEELENLYKKCGIVVMPSSYEGFGLPILDALANKKALVTTETGIAKEALTDGKNAFIVPIKNSKMMADRIIKLIENEKLRKQMAQYGLELSKEYNWESAARKCKNLYDKILTN